MMNRNRIKRARTLILVGLQSVLLFAATIPSLYAANGEQANASSEQMPAAPAQNKTVKGVVKDAYGEPLIGATVVIKGTATGVITDFDGNFVLNVPGQGSVLTISFMGFIPQDIAVGNNSYFNVELKDAALEMEEVTVVAYGVQKKSTLTGAISSVGSEALLKSPSGSLANALSGQLTGVSSIQNSGQPGADDAQIFVRGVGSLTESGAAPLILVDGVERSFTQMDPNEIESINVLKDASATAVFGVRGANGVIIVTTKRGEEGKARISLSSSVGVSAPTRLIDYADSYTYATQYNQMMLNDGTPADQLPFSDYVIDRFRTGDDPIIYPNVDWMDYLIDDLALQTQHNLNVSGGTKSVRYFVSLGYLYQDGLFKEFDSLDYGNISGYSRYNYRANLDVNLTKSTVLKMNLGGILGDQKDANTNVWHKMTYSAPFASAGEIDGKKVMTSPNRFAGVKMGNDVFDSYYGAGYVRKVSNTMNFDLTLSQDLDFVTKGLDFEVKGAYNTGYSYRRKVAGHVETYIPYYLSEVDGSGLPLDDAAYDKSIVYKVEDQNMADTYGDGSTSRARDWYLEASLRYNRKFGEHNVGAILLYNQSKEYYPAKFTEVPTAYIGYVGRVTYDYKSRYMAEFNIGHNGSENFAPGHRFGTFPAGSIGYIISEEDFFPETKAITYLKARASVGLVGNDNMSNNRFLYLPGTYAINDKGTLQSMYRDYNGYMFGLTTTKNDFVAHELTYANPNVTWETALKENYGLDVHFLDNRLKLTADYFRENRKDILIKRSTIPSIISINSSILPAVNMGEVFNHGYEVSLKWGEQINDFSYYVDANVSYSKNKILFQDEVEPNEEYMRRTGNPVNAIFGYVADGFYAASDFDENGALLTETAEDGTVTTILPAPTGTVAPGDIKFQDLNGDNVINNDDQKMIGDPKRPTYTFGLNYGASYKGFFASMNWTAVTGTNVVLSNSFRRPFYEGQALYQFQADGVWTPEKGDSAEYPKFTAVATSLNNNSSTVWMKDASYIKLKNLTIGYNITNKRVLDAISASGLSVKFTGYNLLTFDRLKIFDPEGDLSRDLNTYPITKIFNLGVNVTF